MSQYTVLTIDGGGIRGVIPARILQQIETQMGRPICELFDMVAGTSTGGILSLGLTKPKDGTREPEYSAESLLGLYVDHGGELFPNSFWLKIRSLGGLLDVRYPSAPIEALLQNRFGETPLSQALTEVVVPSYDLSAPGPFFFKRSYTLKDRDWDLPMWQVARATSAAPTYFEPAAVGPFKDDDVDHALVDGGVFANNPTVAAYSDAVELSRPTVLAHSEGVDQPPAAEIYVVSLGTGQPPQSHPVSGGIPVEYRKARHWGLVRWARPMLEVVFDGIEKAVEYQMVRLAGPGAKERYFRLQSTLPTASHAMDDASPENITKLTADAETLLHEQSAMVEKICGVLADVASHRDTNGAR